MRTDESLPWPRLMEIALGALGLSSDEFWAMTPPEWLAAVKGWKDKYGMVNEPPAAIRRIDLQEMIRRFPD